jgi:pheromone shutdown protein TraB
MLTILGTSHVSERSRDEVRDAMQHADLVAIELDHGRAQGLLEEREATFSELRAALGMKAALMASVMRSLQKRIAKSAGVLPGVEMRFALKEAQAQHKHILLIDRDIRVTLKRLSNNFGWPEVKQMIKDLRPRKIPLHPDDDLVAQLMAEMKHTYPRIYTVMVSERDEYMAKALVHIARENPDKHLLAVVGKGHVAGMLVHINNLNADLPVQVWSSKPTS